MIKIKFLKDNYILVKFNGDHFKEYNYYINTMLKYFFKQSKINLGGGWILHLNKLETLKNLFSNITYLNEYIPPPYNDMGIDMKLSPYDYQKEAIFYCINRKKVLLVLPCGSGKSPILIGTYLEAIKNSVIDGPGMIIVKSSLKKQWHKEIQKFSDLKSNIIKTYSDFNTNINNRIKNRKKKLNKLDPIKDMEKRILLTNEIKELEIEAETAFKTQFENYDLFIVNYETLLDEKVEKCIKEKGIDFIGADEIHYAKSKDADRSKALYRFNNVEMKIGATATPITKDPVDVFGIYNFIDQNIFESFSKFQKSFIRYAGRGIIAGFRNKELLQDKIKNNIFVKTKKDVNSQLPSLMVYQKYCDLNSDQLEMYQNILSEIEELNKKDFNIRLKCKTDSEALLNKELQDISNKIMSLQTFAQELCNSPLLLSQSKSDFAKKYACGTESPKLDLCIEMIDEIIQSGEKVVVFSKFERMQPILTNKINKLNKDIKIAYVNGSLSADVRYEEAYTKFRDDPEYKVLLCSDAGAEGLNLSCCKYLIEFELATSYAIQTQRHGRLERADSIHDNVIVFQLIANDSWDIIQQRIIEKKEGYDEDIIKSLIK